MDTVSNDELTSYVSPIDKHRMLVQQAGKTLLDLLKNYSKPTITLNDIDRMFNFDAFALRKVLVGLQNNGLLIPTNTAGEYTINQTLAQRARIKEHYTSFLSAQDLLHETVAFSADQLQQKNADDTIINNVTNMKWQCPTCGKDVHSYTSMPHLIQCNYCNRLFSV